MTNEQRGMCFHACGRAVLVSAHNEPLTEQQTNQLACGHKLLMSYIRLLCTASKQGDGAVKAMIRRVMNVVHSRTNYSSTDALIRDIADICVTFRRLSEGGRRSDPGKSVPAKTLCDALADALTPE